MDNHSSCPPVIYQRPGSTKSHPTPPQMSPGATGTTRIHTREAFRRQLFYSTLMGSKAKALELFHRGWEWPKLCPYHPSPNMINRQEPGFAPALRCPTSRPLTDPRQIDGISRRRDERTLPSLFGTPPLRCSVQFGPMGPKGSGCASVGGRGG